MPYSFPQIAEEPNFLKGRFTWMYRRDGGIEGARCASRQKRRERGIWQRRYWEHKIRDDEDLNRHLNYVHYNPVKHGLVEWPEQWPWSTFHKYARMGWYDANWGAVPVDNIEGVEWE